MKRNYLAFILLISSLLTSFGQAPAFFVKNFGADSLINYGKTVIQMQDESLYYSGYAADSLGNWLIQFYKMDQSGNVLFTRYFPGPSSQAIMERMALHPDGNFIISGTSFNPNGSTDPLLMKIDPNGNLIWQKIYGPQTANSSLLGLNINSNGEILASGFTTEAGNLYIGFLTVLTDANGNILRYQVYSNPTTVMTSDACLFVDDGLIFSGDINTGPNQFSTHVIKTDTSGTFLWEATISNRLNGGCKNAMVDSNGDLIVIGESTTDSSSNFDIQLSKIDLQTGLFKWVQFIQGSNESDAGFSILETLNHDYLLTGYGYDTTVGEKKIVMILTDSSGNELRKKYFGTSPINIGFDIKQTLYDHFLIAGTNYTDGKNVLIHDDPASWTSIPTLSQKHSTIFPNPIRKGELLRWTYDVPFYQLMDVHGKIIFDSHLTSSSNFISTQDLPVGTYFVITQHNDRKFVDKLIVQ